MRLSIACCVALASAAAAQANLVGVSRDTQLRASASAGAINDNKSAGETTFANFDQTINAGAAASGATGSATGTQRSSVGNGSGNFSANGGASSAFSGTGAASSSSSFKYQFLSDTTDLYRFIGGIGQTGSGDVTAFLRDISSPPDVYLLHREVAAGMTPNETWIENFTLQAGHTYEVLVNATSGPAQGSTSFNIQFNAVPEPGVMMLSTAMAIVLMRRIRRS